MAITFNSAFKASRCYANGTLNNYGTYLSCTIDYQSDSLSSYRIEYKKTSEETWQLLSNSSSEYWFNTTFVSASSILSADYAYDVRITVTNDTETVVHSAFVSTSFVLIDFNASGKGLAFGKVSEKENQLEIGMDIYDRFNTRLLNGLAYYQEGGITNPNTTTEELILTSTNTPTGSLFFIRTMFYSSKAMTSNRSQYAYPYNSAGSTWFRTCYNGSWSAWAEQPVIISSGTTGIWSWKRYSDGSAECFGKINLSNVSVASSLGNWYRSDVLYGQYDYLYPITFSEAPSVEMMFQTRNGSAALLWPFSANASTAQYYLPQCYLIRPTTASGINGNINIYAKGKI